MKKIGLVFFTCWIAAVLWAQRPELVIQNGHHGAVTSVAYSPDSQFVLTGSADNTAKLWDRLGREVRTFRGHRSEVQAVAFSPDGTCLLTAGWDNTIKLWDLSGNELETFTGHQAGVMAACFSPDGEYLLSGSDDGTAILWDLSGEILQTFTAHKEGINAVAFSPDGQYLLTGSEDGTAVRWSLAAQEQLVLKQDAGSVHSVTFSPDGQYMLTGANDQAATLWDESGRIIRRFSIGKLPRNSKWAINSRVVSVAFSPDGRRILAALYSGIIMVWDRHGQALLQLQVSEGSLRQARFSENGQQILACYYDIAESWDLQGRRLQSFYRRSDPTWSVAFSEDGRLIATSTTGREVKIWQRTGQLLGTITGHKFAVSKMLFSPDSQKLLTMSADHRPELWDLQGNKLLSLGGEYPNVSSFHFSADGSRILTGTGNKKMHLYDISGKELLTFKGHGGIINAVCLSPDGRRMLTAGSDSRIAVRDHKGKVITSVKVDASGFSSMAFSPDGQAFLTGTGDGIARLWNTSGEELLRLERHGHTVRYVGFSNDGQTLLTGSYDGTAKIWDRSGNLLHTLAHGAAVAAVRLIADGQLVMTGGLDGTAKFWDRSTGELQETFHAFSGETDRWVRVNRDNYYMGGGDLSDFVHFRIGKQTYLFEQFDLRLNRPDKVLETLLPFTTDTALIGHYRQAYHKRLEKYGFTEDMLSDEYQVPQCRISNRDQLPLTTQNGLIQLKIEANDTLRLLDRLNVFVNDVPIYGLAGIDLRLKSTRNYTTTVSIPLSYGNNKIQVSVLNQGGAESLKETVNVNYDVPRQFPDLYLLTIGVSDYKAEGKDLKYAAKDARDVAEWYQKARGFGRLNIKTLTDEEVSKRNILALRSWLEGSRVDDQVMIYVAGHGLLDRENTFYFGTHDIDFAQPAGRGISYDELESLIDGIPARKKLLLIDACHSGEYDEAEAMAQEQAVERSGSRGLNVSRISRGDGEAAPVGMNSFRLMQQLFADLRRGSGATVITSSAGVELSYEDQDWSNGAFTYVFLEGLKSGKADRDNNGLVTATELQYFLKEYVAQLTNGVQVPTFRRQNLEFDFRVW